MRVRGFPCCNDRRSGGMRELTNTSLEKALIIKTSSAPFPKGLSTVFN